jgi:hypothetical protein
VTERKLRYSERLTIAESGALAPLNFDEIPESFRQAIEYVVRKATEVRHVGKAFSNSLHGAVVEHFGLGPATSYQALILSADAPAFLDTAEIIAEEGKREHTYRAPENSGRVIYRLHAQAAMPEFADKFNTLADRHRLGYRFENHEIQRIGSPALSDAIVGPALLAAQRFGWDQVERSFREALRHQRGGSDENDDAVTAASAALESALKATGLPGATLGQLSKAFKGSGLAAPQLRGVPDLLQDLLERSAAVRNIHGDAHGRGPGDDPEAPQELVDLAVHLTGAFIVYLERASR